MPSRTEATRAKAVLCATGRLTPLRLFSTLPFIRFSEGSNKATEMMFIRIHTKPAAFLCFFERATLT